MLSCLWDGAYKRTLLACLVAISFVHILAFVSFLNNVFLYGTSVI